MIHPRPAVSTPPAETPRAVVPELHRLGLSFGVSVLLALQVWVLASQSGAGPTLTLLAGSAALATSLPLITAARWPTPSLAVMCIGILAYRATGFREALLWVGPIAAIYTATNVSGRRYGLPAAVAVALVLSMPLGASLTAVGIVANFVRYVALTAAAAAFGESNRLRRERYREAELRAEQAEKTRAAEAARAIEEERLRIARELHDVTAHSLSVIAIQAELARRSLATNVPTADAALDAIGQTSREALGELRVMLGQLRSDDLARTPTPTLARIPDLAQQLADSGVQAIVETAEDLPPVPPFVEATAFRIMQEAATNIIKHAHAQKARIQLGADAHELVLRMEDDGVGGRVGEAGHGLIGMRERAAMIGGTLTAGPKPDGGWMVEAHLPLRVTDAEKEPR